MIGQIKYPNCLYSVVIGKKQRIEDMLMKRLHLKDNKGREKSEKFLKGDHNILSFQRDFFFNVYKALEMTGKVHCTLSR